MISVCQDAEEYAELPVRHNEDQLNSQLAQQLPLQVNPHSYDSAHTKTHLLLQAHFSHAQLPCSDYITDTKTVLDNAIRICQVRPTSFVNKQPSPTGDRLDKLMFSKKGFCSKKKYLTEILLLSLKHVNLIKKYHMETI